MSNPTIDMVTVKSPRGGYTIRGYVMANPDDGHPHACIDSIEPSWSFLSGENIDAIRQLITEAWGDRPIVPAPVAYMHVKGTP